MHARLGCPSHIRPDRPADRLTVPDHAWVANVLDDIVNYADTFGLVVLRDSCRLAQAAALKETGPNTGAAQSLARHHRFIDALRALIDFAEAEKLTSTREHLVQALVTATRHLDHPGLASTVIRFPARGGA